MGRRGQLLLAVPATFLADAEVLDVDAAFCQPKIRRICAAPGLLKPVLVVRLVFVGDAVPEQPVGDQKLLEAVHRLALQGPQVAAFDLRIPFVLRFEVPFGREVVEEAGEPADHRLSNVAGGRHNVPKDLLHQGQERLVVCRSRRQGRLLALHLSDNLVNQGMEGARRHGDPAPGLDPL